MSEKMGFWDFLGIKKQTIEKKDFQQNSFGGGNSIFFSPNPSYADLNIRALLSESSVNYNTALRLGSTNTVINRFIRFVADAMGTITIVNQDGDEVFNTKASIIKEEIEEIFGEEKNLREYIFNTVRNFVCCGMVVLAPSFLDEKGHVVKTKILDNRKLSIVQNSSTGEYTLYYNGNKISDYQKTIFIPSLNRSGYGDCMFSGAVDDAIIDMYTKASTIVKYKKGGNPETFYKLRAGISINKENEAKLKREIKEKYHGVDKQGEPMVSNIVEDIQVIDNTETIIKGIDIRLNSNKQLALQLGIDIRALGYLRDKGGSQAELQEIRNSINATLTSWALLLSNTMNSQYEKFVAPLGGLKIKILPTYTKNIESAIDTALKAQKQGIVDKEFVQNLIYNNS